MSQQPKLSPQAEKVLRDFLGPRAGSLLKNVTDGNSLKEGAAILGIENTIEKKLSLEDRQRLTDLVNKDPEAAVARLRSKMDSDPQLAQKVSQNPRLLMTVMGVEQQRPAATMVAAAPAATTASSASAKPSEARPQSQAQDAGTPAASRPTTQGETRAPEQRQETATRRERAPAAASPTAAAANAPSGVQSAAPQAAAPSPSPQSPGMKEFDKALENKDSGLAAFLAKTIEDPKLATGIAALSGGAAGQGSVGLSDQAKEALGVLHAKDKQIFVKLNDLSRNPEFAKMLNKIAANKDLQESMGIGALDSAEGVNNLAKTINRLHQYNKQDKDYIAYVNNKLDTAGKSGMGLTMMRFLSGGSDSPGVDALDAAAKMKNFEGMFQGLSKISIGNTNLGEVFGKMIGFLEKMPIIGPLMGMLKGALGLGNNPVAVTSNNGGQLTQQASQALGNQSPAVTAQFGPDGKPQQPGVKPDTPAAPSPEEQRRLAQSQIGVSIGSA